MNTMKKIKSFSDLVFVTEGEDNVNKPKVEKSIEGSIHQEVPMLPGVSEVSPSRNKNSTSVIDADFKVVDRRAKVRENRDFRENRTATKPFFKKNFVKKDKENFNNSGKQVANKKHIRYPNNEYANRNEMIPLKKEENCWSFDIGNSTIKASLKFPCFRDKEQEEEVRYFCQEKTWRFSKLIPVNGMDVIVPDRDYSTTFLDINNIGESEVISIEPADEKTEVILGPEYECIRGSNRALGRVISHNGPVYVRFLIKGKSIEDSEKELIVEIAVDGISTVVK